MTMLPENIAYTADNVTKSTFKVNFEILLDYLRNGLGADSDATAIKDHLGITDDLNDIEKRHDGICPTILTLTNGSNSAGGSFTNNILDLDSPKGDGQFYSVVKCQGVSSTPASSDNPITINGIKLTAGRKVFVYFTNAYITIPFNNTVAVGNYQLKYMNNPASYTFTSSAGGWCLFISLSSLLTYCVLNSDAPATEGAINSSANPNTIVTINSAGKIAYQPLTSNQNVLYESSPIGTIAKAISTSSGRALLNNNEAAATNKIPMMVDASTSAFIDAPTKMGQILTYEGASGGSGALTIKWAATPIGTTPTDGQVLTWDATNGLQWESLSVPNGLDATVKGQVLVSSAATGNPFQLSKNTSPTTTGQVLTWDANLNNAEWTTPVTGTTLTGNVNDMIYFSATNTHTNFTTTATGRALLNVGLSSAGKVLSATGVNTFAWIDANSATTVTLSGQANKIAHFDSSGVLTGTSPKKGVLCGTSTTNFDFLSGTTTGQVLTWNALNGVEWSNSTNTSSTPNYSDFTAFSESVYYSSSAIQYKIDIICNLRLFTIFYRTIGTIDKLEIPTIKFTNSGMKGQQATLFLMLDKGQKVRFNSLIHFPENITNFSNGNIFTADFSSLLTSKLYVFNFIWLTGSTPPNEMNDLTEEASGCFGFLNAVGMKIY